jgi:hypothetical protein
VAMRVYWNILFTGDWLPTAVRYDNHLGLNEATLIGNLECAIADRGSATSKAYSIILPSSSLCVVLRSPFAALSVANNHVYDAGSQAFNDMLSRLKRNGKPMYYGTIQYPHADLTIGGRHIAVIGCLEKCWSRGPTIFIAFARSMTASSSLPTGAKRVSVRAIRRHLN